MWYNQNKVIPKKIFGYEKCNENVFHNKKNIHNEQQIIYSDYIQITPFEYFC